MFYLLLQFADPFPVPPLRFLPHPQFINVPLLAQQILVYLLYFLNVLFRLLELHFQLLILGCELLIVLDYLSDIALRGYLGAEELRILNP